MPKVPDPHFDRQALLDAVNDQPIGLRVSTNHPEGFRRLMYLHMRKTGQKDAMRILQCPKSPNAFLLVKADVDFNTLKEEPSDGASR